MCNIEGLDKWVNLVLQKIRTLVKCPSSTQQSAATRWHKSLYQSLSPNASRDHTGNMDLVTNCVNVNKLLMLSLIRIISAAVIQCQMSVLW